MHSCPMVSEWFLFFFFPLLQSHQEILVCVSLSASLSGAGLITTSHTLWIRDSHVLSPTPGL